MQWDQRISSEAPSSIYLNALRHPYISNAGYGQCPQPGLSHEWCHNENDIIMRIAGLVAASTGLRYGKWRHSRVASAIGTSRVGYSNALVMLERRRHPDAAWLPCMILWTAHVSFICLSMHTYVLQQYIRTKVSFQNLKVWLRNVSKIYSGV